MDVYHSYVCSRHYLVTGCLPRICLRCYMFIETLPSNGSICHIMYICICVYVWMYPWLASCNTGQILFICDIREFRCHSSEPGECEHFTSENRRLQMDSKIENRNFLENVSKGSDYFSIIYGLCRKVMILPLGFETGNVVIVETNFNDQTVFVAVAYSADICGLATIDFISKVKKSRSIVYEKACAMSLHGLFCFILILIIILFYSIIYPFTSYLTTKSKL
jgi:hypothetical protein